MKLSFLCALSAFLHLSSAFSCELTGLLPSVNNQLYGKQRKHYHDYHDQDLSIIGYTDGLLDRIGYNCPNDFLLKKLGGGYRKWTQPGDCEVAVNSDGQFSLAQYLGSARGYFDFHYCDDTFIVKIKGEDEDCVQYRTQNCINSLAPGDLISFFDEYAFCHDNFSTPSFALRYRGNDALECPHEILEALKTHALAHTIPTSSDGTVTEPNLKAIFDDAPRVRDTFQGFTLGSITTTPQTDGLWPFSAKYCEDFRGSVLGEENSQRNYLFVWKDGDNWVPVLFNNYHSVELSSSGTEYFEKYAISDSPESPYYIFPECFKKFAASLCEDKDGFMIKDAHFFFNHNPPASGDTFWWKKQSQGSGPWTPYNPITDTLVSGDYLGLVQDDSSSPLLTLVAGVDGIQNDSSGALQILQTIGTTLDQLNISSDQSFPVSISLPGGSPFSSGTVNFGLSDVSSFSANDISLGHLTLQYKLDEDFYDLRYHTNSQSDDIYDLVNPPSLESQDYLSLKKEGIELVRVTLKKSFPNLSNTFPDTVCHPPFLAEKSLSGTPLVLALFDALQSVPLIKTCLPNSFSTGNLLGFQDRSSEDILVSLKVTENFEADACLRHKVACALSNKSATLGFIKPFDTLKESVNHLQTLAGGNGISLLDSLNRTLMSIEATTNI